MSSKKRKTEDKPPRVAAAAAGRRDDDGGTSASSAGEEGKAAEITEEQRRLEERRAYNRANSARARLRAKQQIATLQTTVDQQQLRLKELEESNAELTDAVQRLTADKQSLELAIQQISQGGGTGGGAAGMVGLGGGNLAQGSLAAASLLQQSGGMRAPPNAAAAAAPFPLDQVGITGGGAGYNPSLQDVNTMRYLSSIGGASLGGFQGAAGVASASPTLPASTLLDTIRRLGDSERNFAGGPLTGAQSQTASLSALLGNSTAAPMPGPGYGAGPSAQLQQALGLPQDQSTAAALELLLARQQLTQQSQQSGTSNEDDSASDLAKQQPSG